jgi:hypothetical protein
MQTFTAAVWNRQPDCIPLNHFLIMFFVNAHVLAIDALQVGTCNA